MCAVVRWPLGSPGWIVFVKAFLLLGAAISCALISAAWRSEQGKGTYATMFVATVAVFFLPCLTWLIGAAADIATYPLLIGLLAAGIWRVAASGREMAGRQAMLALFCGGLAGFGYFLLINSRGYATVLTPEQAVTGVQHMDTLFHASIANMLVKHGALGTGLNGFVPLKYHVLSHMWLGCLGLWLGVSTLESYYIGAQVVCIPMLLFALSLATGLLRPSGEGLASGALVTLCPLLLLFAADFWGWTSYLVSESYFLALIIFLLALPLLAETTEPLSWRRLIMQMLILGVAGLAMAFAKISVGVIFLCAAGWLLWRAIGLTLKNLVILAVPMLLAAAAIASFIFADAYHLVQALDPFSFVREFPAAALSNIAENLALLYAAAIVWRSGTPRDRRCAEAFVIIVIASMVPALLLDIPGGSAFYFINVGTWAGIVFVSAYGGHYLAQWRPGLLRPELVLTAIVLLAFATNEKRASAAKLANQFTEVQTRIRALTGEGTEAVSIGWQRIFALLVPGGAERKMLAHDVERTAGARSERTLLAMGLAQDNHAAVFVPPDNLAFWTLYEDCRSIPFFVPAALGAPTIRGINPPALKCPKEPHYGYPAYAADAVSQPTTDSELCSRAATSGLKIVFVLSTPATGRKIDCASLQGKG